MNNIERQGGSLFPLPFGQVSKPEWKRPRKAERDIYTLNPVPQEERSSYKGFMSSLLRPSDPKKEI